jgi:hypothetical protein
LPESFDCFCYSFGQAVSGQFSYMMDTIWTPNLS